MKARIFYTVFALLGTKSTLLAQVLAGTLTVLGSPTITQPLESVVKEAGMNQTEYFESAMDAVKISYFIEGKNRPFQVKVCEQNIFRYSVFMHTFGAPDGIVVEAKTVTNGGLREPPTTRYDDLLIQPLGPRDLTPSNGGRYIPLPSDPSAAIKVMEFVGCRSDIPIQFRFKPSYLNHAGLNKMEVIYTVTASEI